MTTTATVETLTAEVRVLMVGSRQITLSVARQLDRVKLGQVLPMGRVNLGEIVKDQFGYKTEETRFYAIGRHYQSGALVLAEIWSPSERRRYTNPHEPYRNARSAEDVERRVQYASRHAAAADLPLIVLAGLR